MLGENPIRANYTGQPVFVPGTHTADLWFNPGAFATPPAYAFGNVGRNIVYGPGLQMMDVALVRNFAMTERVRFQIRGGFFNTLDHTNLARRIDLSTSRSLEPSPTPPPRPVRSNSAPGSRSSSAPISNGE